MESVSFEGLLRKLFSRLAAAAVLQSVPLCSLMLPCLLNPHCCAVSVVQQKLGWREVEASESWDIAWIDSSVSATRVMRLFSSQVGHGVGRGKQAVWLRCCQAPVAV